MEEMRERLLALLDKYPGLHVREAARQLDTSATLVEYHADALSNEGIIERVPEGRYVRLYRAGFMTEANREVLAILRKRLPMEAVLQLLESPGLRHGELADRMGIGKGRLSFHLDKLVDAGIVSRDDGLHVADPDTIRELIRDNRPTKEMRSSFADLWIKFYES